MSKGGQVTRFGDEYSTSHVINGGVRQESRVGPIAFIIHINALHAVIKDSESNFTESSLGSDNDDDLTMFMDDTTLSEVLNVRDHVSGMQIGSAPIKWQ